VETNDATQDRVRARDEAMRLLNRLTTGAAVSAVLGVGLFGAVSAYTIPGTKTTSATASASTTSTSSSSTSTSTSSGLQSSTTPVTGSSSSGVAVSGGS